MFKQSMMTLSALAVLVAFSGVSRAQESNIVAPDSYKATSCAEATQAAWFVREMERSDGDTPHDPATPVECSREFVATAGVYEESK